MLCAVRYMSWDLSNTCGMTSDTFLCRCGQDLKLDSGWEAGQSCSCSSGCLANSSSEKRAEWLDKEQQGNLLILIDLDCINLTQLSPLYA